MKQLIHTQNALKNKQPPRFAIYVTKATVLTLTLAIAITLLSTLGQPFRVFFPSRLANNASCDNIGIVRVMVCEELIALVFHCVRSARNSFV